MTSRHLESRITQHYGGVHLHAVFIEIVGYSNRQPARQYEVMRGFTELIHASLGRLSSECAGRISLDADELASSILKMPTAEGAVVVFTLEQWPNAPRDFVRCLTESHAAGAQPPACIPFARQNWCDCHSGFLISTEIQSGEGFVYRDVNDSYGIAGSSVDLIRRARAFGQELVSTTAVPSLWPVPPVLRLEL